MKRIGHNTLLLPKKMVKINITFLQCRCQCECQCRCRCRGAETVISKWRNCFSHISPNNMRNISVEENAYDFYKQNLSFGKRYEVKLPLQTICESLPDNYSIAKSRLVGL